MFRLTATWHVVVILTTTTVIKKTSCYKRLYYSPFKIKTSKNQKIAGYSRPCLQSSHQAGSGMAWHGRMNGWLLNACCTDRSMILSELNIFKLSKSTRKFTTLWVQIVQVSIDILSCSTTFQKWFLMFALQIHGSQLDALSLWSVLVYNSCMICMNDLNLNWNSVWSSTRLRIETLLLMGMDQDRQLANLQVILEFTKILDGCWPSSPKTTARHVRIASFSLDASRFFGILFDRAAPGAMLGISDTMFRVGTTVVRQNIIIYIYYKLYRLKIIYIYSRL